MDEIEQEAEHVEEGANIPFLSLFLFQLIKSVAGLERRHVRRDALKMARAEQHLEKQPGPKGGLKHQKAG